MVGLVIIQGCTAVVVGAGEQAYSHIRGDLLGIIPEPLEKAYPASVEAVKNLEGYDITEQNVNILNGYIIAYDSNARKVQIDLKKTEHNQTQVSIRIGAVGSKLESVHIYDRIQYYLKAKPVVQNIF
jgi:hypothetical protein